MTDLIVGIVLLAWGIWCVIAAILNKKIQVQIFSNDEFLPKKILGKHYDRIMNIVYGFICIAFGSFLVVT